MTHPALNSVEDAIDTLQAVLDGQELTLLQRTILQDMKTDLNDAIEINTFRDIIELANRQAAAGYY